VGDSVKAAEALWRDAAVRVLPGRYIAHENNGRNPGERYIRVAIVHDPDSVAEAMTRMRRVLSGAH
jgi:N-succinyldiaminopimelate aminotransferase